MRISKKKYKVLRNIVADGFEPKMVISQNYKVYIAKFNNIRINNEGKKERLSYNITAEHYASRFIRESGGNAHKTKIVELEINDTYEEVVLCEDFTASRLEFIPYNCLYEEYKDELNYPHDKNNIDTILTIINKIEKADKGQIIDNFYQQLLYDILLANGDRHSGNWGVVYDSLKDEYYFKTIYDNGLGLLARYDPEEVNKIEDDLWWRYVTSDYPKSKITVTGEESLKDILLLKKIPQRYVNRIRNLDISRILDKTFKTKYQLPKNTEKFYRKLIRLRFNRIFHEQLYYNKKLI